MLFLHFQTTPSTSTGANELPSIILNTPDDELEDEALIALMTNKTNKDDIIGENNNSALNSLAPDDAVSVIGSR